LTLRQQRIGGFDPGRQVGRRPTAAKGLDQGDARDSRLCCTAKAACWSDSNKVCSVMTLV
jgi:hypothetical protein